MASLPIGLARATEGLLGALDAPTGASTGAQGVWAWGEPGRGKSHWAAVVVRECEARGRACRWYSATRLFDAIRKAQSEGRSGSVDALGDADVVVLDDVLATRNHAWCIAAIEDVLRRAWDCAKPMLIITSNERPDVAMRRFSTPIQSRVGDLFRSLEVVGSDRRQAMRPFM